MIFTHRLPPPEGQLQRRFEDKPHGKGQLPSLLNNGQRHDQPGYSHGVKRSLTDGGDAMDWAQDRKCCKGLSFFQPLGKYMGRPMFQSTARASTGNGLSPG